MEDDLKLQDSAVEDNPQPQPEEEAQAPPSIQKHFPALARRWNSLDQEDQEAVLEDLVTRLDSSGSGADTGEQGGTGRSSETAEPDKTGRNAGADADPFADVPSPISEVHAAKLREYFGDDPELQAAIDSLTKGVNWMRNVGVDAYRGLKEQADHLARLDGDVAPIRDQRQFEDALVSYNQENNDVLGKLSEPQYRAVSSSAIHWHRSNPSAPWTDAIELALSRTLKGKPILPDKTPDPERFRRAALANAAASRGGKPAPSGEKVVQSIDDLGEVWEEAKRAASLK